MGKAESIHRSSRKGEETESPSILDERGQALLNIIVEHVRKGAALDDVLKTLIYKSAPGDEGEARRSHLHTVLPKMARKILADTPKEKALVITPDMEDDARALVEAERQRVDGMVPFPKKRDLQKDTRQGELP